MKNIFKNAYFGKAYKTRDGRKALYHSVGSVYKEDGDHMLILENSYGYFHYKDNGTYYHNNTTVDIISEWREEINEEEIEYIATIAYRNMYIGDCSEAEIFRLGFKAGYRKAKEERL